MPRRKKPKHHKVTRGQLARVIFRTMRIEQSGMTKSAAKRAAAKVRLGR